MYRRTFLLSIVLGLLALSSLLVAPLNVLALTATLTATRTPTGTGACNPPPPTYTVQVSPSAISVNPGDQITVTVTTNVGLATFNLAVIDTVTGVEQSETDPIFNPARPPSQRPTSGTTSVQWTLTAVRPGTVIFRGSASGEVQRCENGVLFWISGSASGQSGNVTVNGASITPTPTVTRTPTVFACNPPPPTYTVQVSPSAISVNTGDEITVRVTTNVGIATFSLAVIDTATGVIQSETDPIFNPARPASQRPPGGVNNVTWTLTAVRPGTVIFRGSASGEVQACQNGVLFWTFGAASGQSGNVTVNGVSITPTPTVAAGQPDLLFPANAYWVWDPNAYDTANQCYHYTPSLVWNVQVKNNGSADAGSFVVNQNYDRQQTVSGLAAGQSATLYFPFPGRPVATAAPGQPTLSPSSSNFLADYTNLVSESNETNNTTVSFVPAFTATPSGGPTKVFCKTPTPGTPVATFTPTPTPTRTRTGTRTNTPFPVTITRTPTRTQTRVPTITSAPPITNTPTQSSGNVCSPVTSVITSVPFTQGGVGDFCWQAANLGSFINNWNMTSLTMNGVNFTNLWVASSSFPAKINGFWYIRYLSTNNFSQFETRP